MNFKEINIKDLETAVPNNSEVNLETMSTEEKEKYVKLYSLYRKLFTEHFIKKLSLEETDQKFANSEFGFIPTKSEDMDMYQYFSSDVLQYLYLRNNIYVERLNNEEKNVLINKLASKNYEYDEESETLIENTFDKVISEGNRGGASFGPDSGSFMAPVNSIVIGMRYDEFADTDMDDNEWDMQHTEQIKFLVDVLNSKIEEIRNSKFATPVTILKYSEMSVVRRNIDTPTKVEPEGVRFKEDEER